MYAVYFAERFVYARIPDQKISPFCGSGQG